ncbi:AHH domain-containing protein [Pyxidicoccus sp. QH1ED-7-1]|uniref:AHH domain-containing protein n=1 Tax=Pyxidicoccus xibeiensis TaxID=2906759 RepID=UPI0020A81738|nr:AHH domain-containing protein [Pyxidicoccus xibeiensis]MCP3136721.1 AHH domain-containing protein [Pyxidicoccus xibeiensis]
MRPDADVPRGPSPQGAIRTVVSIKGHQGPHPQAYHEEVFQRFFEATNRCRSMGQCREALTEALHRLARETATEGSRLNKLVTRSE